MQLLFSKRTRGGPAPLISNPAKNLAVYMGTMKIVFIIFGALSIIVTSLLQAKCHNYFSYCLYLAIALGGGELVTSFLLRFMEHGSDDEWRRISILLIIESILDVILLVWNISSVFQAIINTNDTESAFYECTHSGILQLIAGIISCIIQGLCGFLQLYMVYVRIIPHLVRSEEKLKNLK